MRVFPVLPPYEIPTQDADLLDVGINFGTIAPVLRRCAMCGHYWDPPKPRRKQQQRRACDLCADTKRRIHGPPHAP